MTRAIGLADDYGCSSLQPLSRSSNPLACGQETLPAVSRHSVAGEHGKDPRVEFATVWGGAGSRAAWDCGCIQIPTVAAAAVASSGSAYFHRLVFTAVAGSSRATVADHAPPGIVASCRQSYCLNCCAGVADCEPSWLARAHLWHHGTSHDILPAKNPQWPRRAGEKCGTRNSISRYTARSA